MDSASKLNLERLYSAYKFIGISLDDFDMLVETVIIDYKKKHNNSEIDFKKIEEEVRRRLERFTRESFDSYKGSLTTINGYINERFGKYDSYERNLSQLKELIAFVEKYEYIPEPTLIIDLLENNVLFNSAVQAVFLKNKDTIIEGNINNIYHNDLLIEFIELYCMTNNIEIKEKTEDDLLEGLSDISSSDIDEEGKEESISTTSLGGSRKKKEKNIVVSPALTAYIRSVSKIPVFTREEELEEIILAKSGAVSKDHFIECNLRLVVSIAKKYSNFGIPLLDIISFGNIGLLEAYERFDYKKGYKFSTYASQWIRNEIYAGILISDKFIRLPSYKIREIRDYNSAIERLQEKLGREPVVREIAEEMDVKEEKVLQIQKDNKATVSLNSPVGEDEDAELEEFVPADIESPEEEAITSSLASDIRALFEKCHLTPKEKLVLKYRFGLEGVDAETLVMLGRRLGVTRERVRQIEESALKKLRHSKSTRAFAIYMDDPDKALEYLDNENMIKPRYKYSGRNDVSPINSHKSYKPTWKRNTGPRVVKPKVVQEDNLTPAYEITMEDEEILSDLICNEELQNFQTIISLQRFIIVMLHSGFVNGKKFSNSAIAKYLNISEEEVETTVNSVTKYYASYINKVLEERNKSTTKKV